MVTQKKIDDRKEEEDKKKKSVKLEREDDAKDQGVGGANQDKVETEDQSPKTENDELSKKVPTNDMKTPGTINPIDREILTKIALDSTVIATANEQLARRIQLSIKDFEWTPKEFGKTNAQDWQVMNEIPGIYTFSVKTAQSLEVYKSQNTTIIANTLSTFKSPGPADKLFEAVARENANAEKGLNGIKKSIGLFGYGFVSCDLTFDIKGFDTDIKLEQIDDSLIKLNASFGNAISDDDFRRRFLTSILAKFISMISLRNVLVAQPGKLSLAVAIRQEPIFSTLLDDPVIFDIDNPHLIWAAGANTVDWFRNFLEEMFMLEDNRVILRENPPLQVFGAGIKLRSSITIVIDQVAADLINHMHDDYFDNPLEMTEFWTWIANFTHMNELIYSEDPQYDSLLRRRTITFSERKNYLLRFFLDAPYRSSAIQDVIKKFSSTGIFMPMKVQDDGNLMKKFMQNSDNTSSEVVNYAASISQMSIDMNTLTAIDLFGPFFEPTFMIQPQQNPLTNMLQICSILLYVNLFPQISMRGMGQITYLIYGLMNSIFPELTDTYIRTYGWEMVRQPTGWVRVPRGTVKGLSLTEMINGKSVSLLITNDITTPIWSTIAQMIRPRVFSYQMPKKGAAGLPFMTEDIRVTTSHEYFAGEMDRTEETQFVERGKVIARLFSDMRTYYKRVRGEKVSTSVETQLNNISSVLDQAARTMTVFTSGGIAFQQYVMGHELEYVTPNFEFEFNGELVQVSAQNKNFVISAYTTERNPKTFTFKPDRIRLSLDAGLAILLNQDSFLGRQLLDLVSTADGKRAGTCTLPDPVKSATELYNKLYDANYEMTSLLILQTIKDHANIESPFRAYSEFLNLYMNSATTNAIISYIDQVRGTNITRLISDIGDNQGLVDPRVLKLAVCFLGPNGEIAPRYQPPQSFYGDSDYHLDPLSVTKGHIAGKLFFNQKSAIYRLTQGIRLARDKLENLNPYNPPPNNTIFDWENTINDLPARCLILAQNGRRYPAIRMEQNGEVIHILRGDDLRWQGVVFELETLRLLPSIPGIMAILREGLLTGRIGFRITGILVRYDIHTILDRTLQVFSDDSLDVLFNRCLAMPKGGIMEFIFLDTTQAVLTTANGTSIHDYLVLIQPDEVLPSTYLMRGVTVTGVQDDALFIPPDPDNWSYGRDEDGDVLYPSGDGSKSDYSKINFNNTIKVINNTIQDLPKFYVSIPTRKFVPDPLGQ